LACSGDIPAYYGTENSQNSDLKHSAEEKNAQNSVPWNKNRNKLSEFRSEPFRGRKIKPEFPSVELRYKQTLGIPLRTIPWKRKLLGIPFHGTKIEATLGIPFQSISWTKSCSQFCLLEQNFLSKLIFSCNSNPFRASELTLS
jgi:hypothetical protein